MVFLIVWPVISLIAAIIPDLSALRQGQTSFGMAELATRFTVRLGAGFLIALVVFGLLLLVKGTRYHRVAIVLCDRCGTVKRVDSRELCDCGGSFVDIEKMKWVEDPALDNSREEAAHRP